MINTSTRFGYDLYQVRYHFKTLARYVGHLVVDILKRF